MNCPNCNKSFTPTRSWQRFCSKECKRQYNNKQRPSRSKTSKVYFKNCQHCDYPIETIYPNKRFCSTKCQKKNHYQRSVLGSPKKIEKTCEI